MTSNLRELYPASRSIHEFELAVSDLHTLFVQEFGNPKGKPVVFMIDGNIINGNYDKYMVDEDYLLRIIVDKIENTKDNIDLGLIKLLTKSDENIKKVNEIRIRGTEMLLSK